MLIGAAIGLVLGLIFTALEGIYTAVMANPVNRRRMKELIHGKALAEASPLA
jgi:hypothetical protein